MEERLQLDVKAWLTSKERARIEVSETSTISPKRIDAHKSIKDWTARLWL